MECGANIISSRERRFAEVIGEDGRVGGGEGCFIACGGQLSIDDVVSLDGGFAVGVVRWEVFKAGFEYVNHVISERESSLECDGD